MSEVTPVTEPAVQQVGGAAAGDRGRADGPEGAGEARPPRLTHLDAAGEARMVDVSAKPETLRTAVAVGAIRMAPATLLAVREHRAGKGDVIAVARVAGIQGAKRTAELIPLCHPLPLTDLQVEIVEDAALPGLRVAVTARTLGRTGVEMEALTGASVTLLTLWDMVKGVDPTLRITDISLQSKTGGTTRSAGIGTSET